MKFQKATVRELKKRLRAKSVHGLALDIDDTLSYTDHHYFKVMAEFINPEKLTEDQIIEKYGRFRRVPYWQSEKAFRIEKKLMHSGDFHAAIPPIEDASRIIRKIDKVLPIVAYITARPASTYKGTQKWLERYRFPNVPIIFRSSRTDHPGRHSWKADVLKALYPEVLGIVDDHPKLKRELRDARYKGKLLLYDNGKNEKTYHSRLVHFKNWQEILTEVEKFKQSVSAKHGGRKK